MLVLSSAFARLLGGILLVPSDVIDAELPMLPPVPSSWTEFRRRQKVDDLLRKCWNEYDGFECQIYDEWLVNEQDFSLSSETIDKTIGFRPSTYGEVTSKGARQLIHAMGIPTKFNGNESEYRSTIFYDLGSGAGKLVAQVGLETLVEKSVGVELSPSRHEAAMRSMERLEQTSISIPYPDGIRLLQSDMFEVDLADATHIYLSSLCFTPEMMLRLEAKLLGTITDPNTDSRLRCVASLRKFPNWSLKPPRTRFVEMSWTRPKGIAVFFYDIEQ